MKRTSKKLLSFFLAVVMVVTSCSVGFTAFAADGGSASTYSSQENAEAYKKVESILNFVIPSLLGITVKETVDEVTGEVISKQTLGDLIGMDAEKVKTAKIKDVIAAVTPILMDLLASGGTDAQSFLTSHSSITGITEATWKDKYYNYYSYLDNTEKDGLSFYALYTLCENNKNDTENPEFAEYCKTTLEKLNVLLNICSAAEKAYDTRVNAANNEYENNIVFDEASFKDSSEYIGELFAYAASTRGDDSLYLTASQAGELEGSYGKLKDLPLTDASGNKTAYGYGVDICNDALKNLGVNLRATNAAEAAFYYFISTTSYLYNNNGVDEYTNGLSFVQALQYIKLANDGGTPLKYNGTALTLDNYATVLGAINSSNELVPGIVAEKVYESLFDGVEVNFNGMTLDAFCSNSYEAINKAVLVTNGTYADINEATQAINDAKISNTDIDTLHKAAKEGNWYGNADLMYNYINSDECTLSPYVVSLLSYLYDAEISDFSIFCNEIATGTNEAKQYKSTFFNELACARNNGADMPLIDFINSIISGIIAKSEINSGYTIPSASIVSSPRFDLMEVNKFNNAIAPAIADYNYAYSEYAIPDEYAVIVVNNLLNDKVEMLFDKESDIGGIVNPIIEGLLETKVTLYALDGSGVLNDLWLNLYNAPIETVLKLVPVLVALVDEVLLPMLLNQEGDVKYESLNFLISGPDTLLGALALKNGNTDVGISTLSFDLNTLLPALLTILSKDGGYEAAHAIVPTYQEYIDSYNAAQTTEADKYTVEDEGFASVLKITGIYVADKALCGLNIADAIANIKKKDEKGNEVNALSPEVAAMISEVIYNVVDFAGDAVDDYLAQHKDDPRYARENPDSEVETVQRGLNNLSVSLPYLVDSIFKSFAKKYNITSDWTAVPAGKFFDETRTFKDGDSTRDYTHQVNRDIQNIKGCADTSKVNPNEAPAKVYQYLSALIGNWVDGILAVVNGIGGSLSGTTEVFWNFKEYSNKITNSFKYPNNITASEAETAVSNLDELVLNLFPLLKSFGVLKVDSLEQLVNDNLYTNAMVTTIAKGLYGAIEDAFNGIEGVDLAGILADSDLDLSTKGIASYLMDSRYGATYSSAASTLRSVSSWNNVTTLNWGFKDGSAKAQQGFISAIAAVLRPINDILSMFLVGADTYDKAPVLKIINSLDFSLPVFYEEDTQRSIAIGMSGGVFNLVLTQAGEDTNISIDLGAIFDGSHLFEMGTNGYESAIIPILEAFMCDGIKTYNEYVADYKKASDNLLINVLTPVFNLVNDIIEAPATTLTSVLPNVAYFIDSNGLAQAIGNLLAPITSQDGIIGKLNSVGINIDELIVTLAGKPLGDIITDAMGINVKLTMNLSDLSTCNIQDIILPLVKSILASKNIDIKIPDFTFAEIASHGTIETVASKAKNSNGQYTTKRVVANKGEVLVAVLRYVADVLIRNASYINNALQGIDAIKKNATIKNILDCVFSSIRAASKDDIVRAVFYLLAQTGSVNVAEDSFFDYSNFKTKENDFSFGEMDEDFCRKLAPMLDGLVNGLLVDKGGLNGLLGGMVYTDEIVSTIAVGLYGAIEGVSLGDMGSLSSLLAKTGIDFSTTNVANLLTDKSYGQQYSSVASKIKSAGSWKKVNKSSLSWGVTDRDSFVHAIAAALRPLYGVLDVILNNSRLNLFNVVKVQGSDGYTSFIVPLLEAFGCYNIKTQYDYRMDMSKEYDAILIDILNPILDKVEDVLNAPVQMLADILPNLSLFFANDGLLQIIDNLLTPVSALLDALKPIVNVNSVLKVLGFNLNSLLAKIGIKTNVNLDIYNLKATLAPLISADNVVSLLNGILSTIKIGGKSLGIVLPEIDWFTLASHGTVIRTTSQAAIIGERIMVQSDQDETLIAVLRFLINTINYKDNYNAIVGLVGGLLGGANDTVSGVVDQVLGMLQGDADTVIAKLVDLLQTLAG